MIKYNPYNWIIKYPTNKTISCDKKIQEMREVNDTIDQLWSKFIRLNKTRDELIGHAMEEIEKIDILIEDTWFAIQEEYNRNLYI